MIRLQPLLLGVALLVACESVDPFCTSDDDCSGDEVCLADDPEGELMLCGVDADGDGLRPGPMDCDDSDPLVNVNAPERCNAIDDDCDGEIDELGDSGIWFLDADGDGYGDPEGGTPNCRPELGLAGVDGDCDDDNPDVHPVAEEVCNGIDDDCDGYVDDRAIDAVPLHADQDGDGWGVEEATLTCPGAGWVEAEAGPWDCDDRDAEMFPGSTAPDLGMDGRDVDCDGSDACTDLDCDGVADLVWSNSTGFQETGTHVYLSAGQRDLTSGDHVVLDGNWMLFADIWDVNADGYLDLYMDSTDSSPNTLHWGYPHGPEPGEKAEIPATNSTYTVGTFGDFDGDGDLDLFIAGAKSNTGHVYLQDAAGEFPSAYALDVGFDHRHGIPADLNADGFDDIIVDAAESGGSTTIFFGGPGGLDSTRREAPPGVSNWTGLVQVSDLDQDGRPDLILPHIDRGNGALVVWGPENPTDPWSSASVTSLPGDGVVYASVGDLDGDGLPDLLLPSRQPWGNGRTWVVLNDGARFASSIVRTFDPGRVSSASLGDLDADGDLDAILSGNGCGPVSSIWFNDGTGAFTPHLTGIETCWSFNAQPVDIDGDDDLDAAFGAQPSFQYHHSRGRAVVQLNNGGAFSKADAWYPPGAAGGVWIIGGEQ